MLDFKETKRKIKNLIKKGESETVEFKKLLKEKENQDLDFKAELPEAKKVAQLVTALYNSRGGKVILGVEDKTKKLIGLKNPQRTEHKFVQTIRHWCKLDEEPKISFIKYKNKEFIIIYCPKGKDSPYFVRGEHIPRVRIGSSNMPANKEEIARLYREGSSKSQDIYPVENAGINDLDLEKIKQYFKESKFIEQLKGNHFQDLLKKEYFVVELHGKIVPTIAGIILFGKHPSLEMPHTILRADRYKGIDTTMWIDREDINGDAFKIIESTEKFMLKNIRTAYTPKGFKTETKTEYPLEALKEAIVNAIAHRDYHNRESILLKMFDDRIEIWNPGELVRPLTIDQLESLNYKPKSRNEKITDVFSKRKFMDKRGTGVLRMNKFCDEWKLPRPEFKESGGYFGIIFRNPQYYTKTPEIKIELNERQKKAIGVIKDKGEITRKEYIDLNKVSNKTAYLELNKLVRENILRIVGKGRSTKYVFR